VGAFFRQIFGPNREEVSLHVARILDVKTLNVFA
jgi:hypothetical protein